jgi:hypothetical protein
MTDSSNRHDARYDAVVNTELRRTLLTLAGIAWFAVAGAALAAGNTFDGVYVGKRSLTKGPDSLCSTEEEKVSVSIDGETIRVTDSDINRFALAFHPGQDGSFDENYTDKEGDTVKVRGRVIGDVLDADVYYSPCGYHGHLKKK